MKFDFDVIVIGSGFGGSVMSLRLTEKNYKVCLLERGKRYGMFEFPRRIHDVKEKLFWDPEDKKYGYMEVRDYPESDLMSVSASGLGGGSLIYANVLMRMPPDFFSGWPGKISRQILDPYYDKVIDTMEASPYPFNTDSFYKDTPKTKAFMETVLKLEKSEDALRPPEFIFPDLAIRFKGEFPGHQTINKHGAIQSKCTKCGECDIGCNIHAKNTLDLNYLQRAQNTGNHPLEIRTDALVTEIIPLDDPSKGYKVVYSNPKLPSSTTIITAQKVVFSAGSLGTTSLLLKMQKYGHLNNLSPTLGHYWCGNGDLEGTSLFNKNNLDPTNGPVITGAISYRFENYPDGYPHGVFIQDAGFPIGLAWFLAGKGPSLDSIFPIIKIGLRYLKGIFMRIFGLKSHHSEINIGDDFSNAIDKDNFIRKSFVLLGMGRDRNDGKIELREDDNPIIKWSMDKSRLHYERTRREMKKISEGLGGKFVDNPLTHIDKIIAVHPIGGCIMADSKEKGVVNTNGEVFGHEGLFIADASIIPTSLGPNPSLTIAALSEMIADKFPTKS